MISGGSASSLDGILQTLDYFAGEETMFNLLVYCYLIWNDKSY